MLGTLLAAAACGAGPQPPPAGTPPLPPPAGGEHAISVGLANELGASFVPERVEVALDGRLLFVKTAAAGLAEERQLVVASDLVLPAGEHVLTLHLVLRGDGKGVFAYLKEYKFTVRSSHRFQARPGLVIVIHAGERPDRPLEQRPFVRFEETLRADR